MADSNVRPTSSFQPTPLRIESAQKQGKMEKNNQNSDPFGAKATLTSKAGNLSYFRLGALAQRGIGTVRLSYRRPNALDLCTIDMCAVVDLASPEIHPLARTAKDVAAAGVLIAALTAVAVAIVLLLPRLLTIFR